MGESKIVTMKELTDNNPTLCLSPLRVFNKCHLCQYYKQKKGIKLKCVPHLDKEKMQLLTKINQQEKKLKELKAKLEQ